MRMADGLQERERRSTPVRPGGSHCRFCEAPLELTVVDLGKSPLCESFLPPDRLEEMEPFFPLHVRVCERCWLAQLPCVRRRRRDLHRVRLLLGVLGLLGRARAPLRRDDRGPPRARPGEPRRRARLERRLPAPALPAEGISRCSGSTRRRTSPRPRRSAASRRWSSSSASSSPSGSSPKAGAPISIVGNNVLAQVPDLNDFVAGRRSCSRPDGTATFEFPHLARLLESIQYDTIYHEHFSYFSLSTHPGGLRRARARRGRRRGAPEPRRLAPRLCAHAEQGRCALGAVAELLAREESEGLRDPERTARFARTSRSRSGRCSSC